MHQLHENKVVVFFPGMPSLFPHFESPCLLIMILTVHDKESPKFGRGGVLVAGTYLCLGMLAGTEDMYDVWPLEAAVKPSPDADPYRLR